MNHFHNTVVLINKITIFSWMALGFNISDDTLLTSISDIVGLFILLQQKDIFAGVIEESWLIPEKILGFEIWNSIFQATHY